MMSSCLYTAYGGYSCEGSAAHVQEGFYVAFAQPLDSPHNYLSTDVTSATTARNNAYIADAQTSVAAGGAKTTANAAANAVSAQANAYNGVMSRRATAVTSEGTAEGSFGKSAMDSYASKQTTAMSSYFANNSSPSS